MNLATEVLTLKDRVDSLEVNGLKLLRRIDHLEIQMGRQGTEVGAASSTSQTQPLAPNLSSGQWAQTSGLKPPQPPPQPPPPVGTDRIGTFYPLPPMAPTKPPSPGISVTSETLLRWAGLVLVSLAAMFFVSTAINRGWLSPKLQLAGAVAVGIGLHGAALKLERRARSWAHALVHGATLVLAWSAAASFQWLSLVSLEAALGFVCLATLVSTAIAVRLRFSTAATSAGACAAFIPIWMDIFNAASPSAVSIWYATVGVSFVALGLWRKWSEVRIPVSWITTGLLLLGFLVGDAFEGPQGRMSAMVALTALAVALWVGPWIQHGLGEGDSGSSDFNRFVEALDHRSTLALPAAYLAGAALVLSSGTSSGIGELALIVAAGFGAVLAIATVLAPPSMFSNRSRIASSFSVSNATGRRWALPNSLAVSHLFGIGTVLTVAAVDLLNGSTLLVAVAIQALGAAAVAVYFKDVVLGAKAIFLGLVSAAVSAFWMIETIEQSGGLDRGKTAANLVVVVALVGFAVLARFLNIDLLPAGQRSPVVAGEGGGAARQIPEPAAAPAATRRGDSNPLQWWSRERPLVEVADGIGWGAALLWVASVVIIVVDFSLSPGLLALFAALSVAAYRFLGRVVLAIGVGLGILGLTLAGLGTLAGYFESLDFAAHANHLVVALTLVGATALIWSGRVGGSQGGGAAAASSYAALTKDPYRAWLFITAWVSAWGWLGSVVVNGPQGQVAVSSTWAVAGCLALVAGIRFNQPTVRLTGLATLGVVVVKLLTVDLAEVETLWRVGLFFILGLGFMRLGYLLPKLSERYSLTEQAEPPAT